MLPIMPNLNLGGILGNLGLPTIAKARGGTQMPYKDYLGITDGDADYDTEAEVVAIIGALAAGSVWTKIWEKTVEAQTTYRWGFGSPQYPHNQGYMWFVSMDEGTDFQVGKLRLRQASHKETKQFTVLEVDDSQLHGTDTTSTEKATPTNINEKIALPEKVEFDQVGEDSLLQLWYRCIVAATAEDACAFSIPVTIRQ